MVAIFEQGVGLMAWQDGITITVVKQETDELIVSMVVDSKTDIPFVVGDIIEKDGYKTTVEQEWIDRKSVV